MNRRQWILFLSSFVGVFGLLWSALANTYNFDRSILAPTALVAFVVTFSVFFVVMLTAIAARWALARSCSHLANADQPLAGFHRCDRCGRYALDE